MLAMAVSLSGFGNDANIINIHNFRTKFWGADKAILIPLCAGTVLSIALSRCRGSL